MEKPKTTEWTEVVDGHTYNCVEYHIGGGYYVGEDGELKAFGRYGGDPIPGDINLSPRGLDFKITKQGSAK
jgi:hypothetical protein